MMINIFFIPFVKFFRRKLHLKKLITKEFKINLFSMSAIMKIYELIILISSCF